MISKTALHAVKALVTLATLPAGTCMGAAAIARSIGAPPNYLGKLLQGLVRHGLVESQKGLGGGFRLARKAASISLLDVVEPIDQVSRWSGCILGGPKCEDEQPCAIHERWKVVREAYRDLLGRTSLEDLARRGQRGIAWSERALSAVPRGTTVRQPRKVAKRAASKISARRKPRRPARRV